MLGRPANSVSTPTLGTSQQRAQANALKQSQFNNRQKTLSSLFSGGTANRLMLSLRSGIAHEVDYALEQLVQYSYSDATHIPLESLAGLPNALLDVIRPDGRRDEETVRRRLEAALVLRNLTLEGGQRNLEIISFSHDQIFQVLYEVLQQQEEEPTELLIYLCDTAEAFAAKYRLKVPSHRSDLETLPPDEAIYPLLAKLAESNDRALVISAFTFIASLANNEKNEALITYRTDSPFSSSTLSLVHRALRLVPLNDADLLLPISEFLYQYTNIPGNASHLLPRSDLSDLVRLVVRRVTEGAKEEVTEYEYLSNTSEETRFLRGKAIREALMATYPALAAQSNQEPKNVEPPEAIMDEQEVQKILYLPEPDRVRQWMQAVFELNLGGEIAQVALWKAYQKQFDPYDAHMKAGQIPGMLTASDVIKQSSEAFSQALPKVVDDPATGAKRFVISGIKIKEKPAPPSQAQVRLKERWRCRWQGCTDATAWDRAEHLYNHLRQQHVSDSVTQCSWANCTHPVASVKALLFHIRTHILPSGPNNTAAPTNNVLAADSLDRAQNYFTEKGIIAQLAPGQGEYAAGTGFLSALVLRNIARAVNNTATVWRKSHLAEQNQDGGDSDMDGVERGNDGRSPPSKHGGKASGFNFLSGETEGGNVDNDSSSSTDLSKELVLTKEQVQHAVSVLVGVEKEVLTLSAGNRALSNYLVETLVCIESAKKAVQGLL